MENKTVKPDRQEQTGTRERIYSFIVDFMTENLYAPTIREICAGIYLNSISSVYDHLLKLEEEGKIEMKHNATRAIKVIGFQFVKTEGIA